MYVCFQVATGYSDAAPSVCLATMRVVLLRAGPHEDPMAGGLTATQS